MRHHNGSDCRCDECWTRRRTAALAFRREPDHRFQRSRLEHSMSAYTSGRCKCDICREEYNRHRRERRRGPDQ